ncbi:hypothetical protein QTV44_002528 [Vibrio vulnificus]|nr:hypothetical protein [Vibrio vulnificus]
MCSDSERHYSHQFHSLCDITGQWQAALARYHDYVRFVQRNMAVDTPSISEFEVALCDRAIETEKPSRCMLSDPDKALVSLLSNALLHLYGQVAVFGGHMNYLRRNAILKQFLKKRMNDKAVRPRRKLIHSILATWNDNAGNNRNVQNALRSGFGAKGVRGAEIRLEHVIAMAIITMRHEDGNTDVGRLYRLLRNIERDLGISWCVRAPNDSPARDVIMVDQIGFVSGSGFDGQFDRPVHLTLNSASIPKLANYIQEQSLEEVDFSMHSGVGVLQITPRV